MLKKVAPKIGWEAYWVQQFSLRRTNLGRLGFSTYQDYLSSDLWKDIRKRVLAQNPRCPCLNPATEAHHIDYEIATLSGETLAGLVALCRACHQAETDRVRCPQRSDSRDPTAAEARMAKYAPGYQRKKYPKYTGPEWLAKDRFQRMARRKEKAEKEIRYPK